MSNNRVLFFKRFMGFSISAWVNAILSLISTPLITSLFSTADVGKIQLFITIVNLVLNFSYLGIDQAFARFFYEPPEKNNKKTFLGICLGLTGLITLVISVIIFAYGNVISNMILGYVTYIIPVSLCISIFSNVVMRFINLNARMEKSILLFNIQAISITFISNMSYIAVAIHKPSAENAIILRTVLTGIAGIIFLICLRNRIDFKNMNINKNVVITILAYSLPVCPAALLSVANNSIGQILMKHYVSYGAIGIYSNAVTVASIITLIQAGINHYWEPLVYENYKTKQKEIIKMHHVISFIMIIFALCIICSHDLIYTILIGKNFWASKQIFPLLIISPVCYTISETLGIGIRLSKKTILNIPVYLSNLIVNIGLCALLLPRMGVVGAALASAVSSIAMLIVKAIFGECTYRCSDNYVKLAIALLTLFATAFIHTYVYECAIKYILYLIAIIITILCYTREVKSVLLLINDLKNEFLRRSAVNE